MTPFHSSRVRTPLKPDGALAGAAHMRGLTLLPVFAIADLKDHLLRAFYGYDARIDEGTRRQPDRLDQKEVSYRVLHRRSRDATRRELYDLSRTSPVYKCRASFHAHHRGNHVHD